MWISWKHLTTDFPNPPTYEQKVEIFYEQTLGWQLHIADLIANGGTTFDQINTSQPGYEVPSIRHSGFAVLHICVSYFELVGSLVSFETGSTKRFHAGVKEVLPEIFKGTPADDALLKLLYQGLAAAYTMRRGRGRLLASDSRRTGRSSPTIPEGGRSSLARNDCRKLSRHIF